MLLSDIDSKWHDTVEAQKTYYAPDFKPDFWLVNGRAYPDTLKPHPLTITSPNANTNLTQLNYESYVHIKTNDKVLFRMINMGYAAVPWHIHGWHFQVIGKDASPSPFLAISESLMNMNMNMDMNMNMGMCNSSYMEHELLESGFTANIASGETYDLLITATDKRSEYLNYIKNGQNGLPSLCNQVYELTQIDSNSIANIPTNPIGQCPNLNTTNILEICNDKNNSYFFPQFYPMHNHDDYKVTNQGVYPGGQLTLIQTDAPTK